MSQKNVQIVRAALDAWNRGDWAQALKDAAPDVELDNSSNAGEWRGVHPGAGSGEADVGEIRGALGVCALRG